jgi:hypothetical protein
MMIVDDDGDNNNSITIIYIYRKFLPTANHVTCNSEVLSA